MFDDEFTMNNPETMYISAEEKDIFRDCLKRMKSRYSLVLRMKLLGLSFEQIAYVTGDSINQVKNLYSKGREGIGAAVIRRYPLYAEKLFHDTEFSLKVRSELLNNIEEN